jgi:hypothetical protein
MPSFEIGKLVSIWADVVELIAKRRKIPDSRKDARLIEINFLTIYNKRLIY